MLAAQVQLEMYLMILMALQTKVWKFLLCLQLNDDDKDVPTTAEVAK